jgi:monoamine oxidase
VIVVGAGLAGLTAASELHAAGARVVVLEAADRLGGRIQSIVDTTTGRAVADLGPTWVWPAYQPLVTRWLDRLDVTPFPQFDAGDGILDGWGPDAQRGVLPSQDGITRLVGGPASLISALAKRLPVTAVRTNARVAAIAERDATTMVATLHSGEVFTAARVIAAAPARVVASGIAMPDLDRAVVRDLQRVPTWMSAQAKAVALYDRPFWREAGLSGRIASRTGPLFEVYDHTPADASVGAVVGFVQWSPDRRRAEPDALRSAIMAQLVRCLGPQAATPSALHIADWASHQHICSTADLQEPPQHPELAPASLRAGHLTGKLFFAVSETAEVSPGLIEGALAAGVRAAHQAMIGRSSGA